MGIAQSWKEKDEDGNVTHSFITDKGNVATCSYNEKTNLDCTINDRISSAQAEALRKD